VQRVSQSLLGQFVRSGPCPACDGQGQVIETPCPVCDGAGRTLAEQALEVDVPPGIHHGQRIRIRGEGHDGGPGAARGDAYVLVSVAEPEGLTRDGDDLVAVVRITITQAALGVTVEAPGPDGPHVLELEPGVQPGHVHVVRRAGMPSLEHSHRGDLRVHVEVLVPRRLSPDQRAQVLALEQALGDEPYRERDDGLFGRLRSAFR
jgi:molecular chaperone DnaJ